jgi:hypothetical protein
MKYSCLMSILGSLVFWGGPWRMHVPFPF